MLIETNFAELTLLKSEEDYIKWSLDKKYDFYEPSPPKEYPCYGLPQITFSEDYAVNYIYKEDLELLKNNLET